MTKNKVIHSIFYVFFAFHHIYGQTDKEFWFVAPIVTLYNNPAGGQPVYFHINTFNADASIYIEMPSNPAFNDTTLYIQANTYQRFTINYSEIANSYDTLGGINGKNNKGIHIVSDVPVSIIYEYANNNNTDFFSLKGTNALGTEFFTVFQTFTDNQNNDWPVQAYSAFDIVATEDGTVVTIETSKDIYGYTGQPSFFVNLNKGETFTAIPQLNPLHPPFNGIKISDIYSRDNLDRLSGCRITTNGKKIAVTLKDDSMVSPLGTSFSDLGGDQLIPLSIAGKEYIAIKGLLNENISTKLERVYIVGTQNNDSVFINGVFYTTINQGETVVYELASEYTHIRTKAKSYVLQLSGFANDMGEAILPPVDICSGLSSINITRTNNNTFYLYILARKESEQYFRINGNPSTLIPESAFMPVSGTTQWTAARLGPFSTAQFPENTPIRISNVKDVFHIGILNGLSSYSGRLVYLSDYNQLSLEAYNSTTGTNTYQGCYGDTVQLIAKGGMFYEWTPVSFLSDPYSDMPKAYPKTTTTYTVSVRSACNIADAKSVQLLISTPIIADFITDRVSACAPATITYNAEIKKTQECYWSFGNGNSNWIFADTLTFDTTFTHTFSNNGTSPLVYTSQLIVKNKNNCYDTLSTPITIYPQITGGFSLPDTIGCAPLGLQFTNLSSGNTYTNGFYWNFGDNSTSNLQNPFHIFYNEGNNDTTYTIRLIASSPYYCADTTYQHVIVHPEIDVNYALDTIAACENLLVRINNLSKNVDSFMLDWGNGHDTSFYSFSQIEYLYQNTGVTPQHFSLRLFGYNTQGCADSLVGQVHIYPPAQAAFTINPTSGCDSVLINFTDASTGYGLKYFWDFGDNATSQTPSPIHRYINKDTATKLFTATLYLESTNFCRDTLSVNIPVHPYIKALFAIDTVLGCNPLSLTIFNQSVGVDSFAWDFGDNTNSDTSVASIRYTYYNPNFLKDSTYTIRLVVSNQQGCKDSFSRNVTVFSNITADFYPDTSSLCHPASFRFYSNSQGASSFLWNFGDGATSTQNDSAMHSYIKNITSTPDTLTVSLFVVASNNTCTASKDSFIVVYPYTEARFTFDDYIDCSPFLQKFNNTSFGNTNTYSWYVNNSLIQVYNDTTTFIHTFTNPSDTDVLKYIVRLEAINNEGCTHSFEDTIAVYPIPKARFGITPADTGCHPLWVQFVDSSFFSWNYRWIFGNGIESSEQEPGHLYKNFSNDKDTIYTVKLIISADNCSDSLSRQIKVFANPKAAFTVDSTASCPPLTLNISNSSTITSGSYYWSFGDGDDSTITNNNPLEHMYDNTGSFIAYYKINLQATTDKGCKDSTYTIIQIYPRVTADFSYDSAGCSPFDVVFTNLSTNADHYNWTLGNGSQSSVINPPQRYYNRSDHDSTYAIKLKARSLYGCEDSITKYLTVFPRPEVDFSASPISQQYVEYPIVTFTNKTKYNPVWDFYWKFGDGQTSTSSAFTLDHEYHIWGPNNNNNYLYIMLTASNKLHPQCKDSLRAEIRIIPPMPEVSIQIDKGEGCAPLEVTFSAITRYAYKTSTQWNFDDGTTFTGDTVITHTFTEDGIFNVLVTVTGDGGNNQAYQFVYSFRQPIIDFDVDPKALMLPNANMQCFNNTRYATSYLWLFGDGNNSTTEEPAYTYTSAGVFDVTLIAQSEEGCVDSLTKKALITVENPGVVNLPNAFRPGTHTGGHFDPSSDQVDVFRPILERVLETHYLFQIFNRWGEMLFETTDVHVGWDGYYDNKLCKQDVYVYRIKGKYFNGRSFDKTGTVTLIR